MVLFVGYPVTYATACELFRKPIDTMHIKDTIQAWGLDLYPIENRQHILGLRVDEVAYLSGNFASVDQGIAAILLRKKHVVSCLQRAGIDLSDFLLEGLGSEPIRVHNPPPYLITA
jgi:hypothetical protein